jgi:hypothetical protein
MTVRRLLAPGLCLLAWIDVAAAQTPDAGGSVSAEVAVEVDEPPPKDMDGRDEDPGKPGGLTVEQPKPAVKTTWERPTGVYPIEEAHRPINLLANMSEVSIGPHAQLSPYRATDALRARYGITSKVQIGLTYILGSVYNESEISMEFEDKQSFHTGKAIGLDVTVLLTDWAGVRVGVPVYLKPVAASIALGAPLKFIFEKFAFGGLDDLLNITVEKFAPSFYQEFDNAAGAFRHDRNTKQSRGQLRISGFGVYQHRPNLALIGRTGFYLEDFQANKSSGFGGTIYFLRAGLNYSPKKNIDLGLSVGFDDLALTGSFGPAGFFAFRI